MASLEVGPVSLHAVAQVTVPFCRYRTPPGPSPEPGSAATAGVVCSAAPRKSARGKLARRPAPK